MAGGASRAVAQDVQDSSAGAAGAGAAAVTQSSSHDSDAAADAAAAADPIVLPRTLQLSCFLPIQCFPGSDQTPQRQMLRPYASAGAFGQRCQPLAQLLLLTALQCMMAGGWTAAAC